MQNQKVAGKLVTIMAVGKFIRMSLQIIIMAVGAYLVINEELTPGGMMAASIIMTRALTPIEQLIGAWRAFMASRNAIQRVVEQLNTISSTERPVILPSPDGHLEVENLSFALPEENRFVYRGISFNVASGETIGIIGASGSGKTTLAKSLIGLLAPTTGCVRVDGSDIAKWNLDEMGQFIGYFPQRFELFEGTIKQNIDRFTDATIEEVIATAKLAGVHNFIVRLPQGYETYVERNSVILSGGQQQRIALARALFGEPSVIVMDEPNANLDPEGEKSLLSAINALKKKKKTIVLIAHRSNVLKCSDHLLLMRDGRGEFKSRGRQPRANETLGEGYKYVDDLKNAGLKTSSR
jgi:PrtD family type I secretion system ABC transporter